MEDKPNLISIGELEKVKDQNQLANEPELEVKYSIGPYHVFNGKEWIRLEERQNEDIQRTTSN